jgi:hypothetical protein
MRKAEGSKGSERSKVQSRRRGASRVSAVAGSRPPVVPPLFPSAASDLQRSDPRSGASRFRVLGDRNVAAPRLAFRAWAVTGGITALPLRIRLNPSKSK